MDDLAKSSYRLKLARAEEHLKFIAGEGTQFIERNIGSTVPFKPNPPNQWTVVYWGEIEPLDPMWGTYMGDVIHNLRSALDNFLCALILFNNPDHPIINTKFPIYEGEKDWIRNIEQRDCRLHGEAPTDGLSEPLLAALKALQPYHLRNAAKKNSPLRLLQIASNADKHRTVHTSSPRFSAKKAQIGIDPKGHFQVSRSKAARYGTPIEKSAEICRMKLIPLRPPPHAEVRVKIKTSLEIAFSIDGKSLVITHKDLWAMHKEVGRIMGTLEKVAGIRPSVPSAQT
jgi:hypothetical protein